MTVKTRIRQWITMCLSLGVCSLIKISYKIAEVVGNDVFFNAVKCVNTCSDDFVSYQRLPKNIDGLCRKFDHYKLKTDAINEKEAIILAGIIDDGEFLIDTIKYYKKLYPNAKIIVSTWVGQDKKIIRILKEMDVIVVESVERKNPPIHKSINNQIYSVAEGIKIARELGCEYVLRTRTDIRLYRQNLLEYLFYVLQSNPCEYGSQSSKLVIASGRYGNLVRPYFWCDMFVFGKIVDIEKLYDIPMCGMEDFREPIASSEQYLYWNFLNQKDSEFNPEWTLDQSYEAIRRYFVVIDENQLLQKWKKYDYYDLLRGDGLVDDHENNLDAVSGVVISGVDM